eukprot:Gb_02691 [translate_table: standard]
MADSKQNPHIVAFPFVAQGHLIPFLELAKLLASQGLTVSYVSTPRNISRLQPQVDRARQDSNLDIRLVSLPMPSIEGVPPGIESGDNVPLHIATILLTSSHALAQPFEQWLAKNTDINCSSPPVCIIGDMFTGWLHQSAAKFEIPTVVFHTSGAFGISVLHSLVNYTPQKTVEGNDYFEVPELSFDLKLRKSDLPVVTRDPDTDPLREFLKEQLNLSLNGRGLVFNSFYELEPLGIDHFRALTGRPVWSIGPILPPSVFYDKRIDPVMSVDRGKAADISHDECLQWLDSRSPHSVLYISFGSMISLNEKQIRALAVGLERSEQSFIWAMRRAQNGAEEEKNGNNLVPEGFEQRTKERGLIIRGWAPQLLILSHGAIGGFLSHCGWNSMLESVSLGVPMITWPMFAEQPWNSKLLVENLGIGIQLCVDMAAVPDDQEVNRAVTKLLGEEEGKSMRNRAQEIRKRAKKAIETEGSSHTNLQSLVEEMHKLHRDCINVRHGNGILEDSIMCKVANRLCTFL